MCFTDRRQNIYQDGSSLWTDDLLLCSNAEHNQPCRNHRVRPQPFRRIAQPSAPVPIVQNIMPPQTSSNRPQNDGTHPRRELRPAGIQFSLPSIARARPPAKEKRRHRPAVVVPGRRVTEPVPSPPLSTRPPVEYVPGYAQQSRQAAFAHAARQDPRYQQDPYIHRVYPSQPDGLARQSQDSGIGHMGPPYAPQPPNLRPDPYPDMPRTTSKATKKQSGKKVGISDQKQEESGDRRPWREEVRTPRRHSFCAPERPPKVVIRTPRRSTSMLGARIHGRRARSPSPEPTRRTVKAPTRGPSDGDAIQAASASRSPSQLQRIDARLASLMRELREARAHAAEEHRLRILTEQVVSLQNRRHQEEMYQQARQMNQNRQYYQANPPIVNTYAPLPGQSRQTDRLRLDADDTGFGARRDDAMASYHRNANTHEPLNLKGRGSLTVHNSGGLRRSNSRGGRSGSRDGRLSRDYPNFRTAVRDREHGPPTQSRTNWEHILQRDALERERRQRNIDAEIEEEMAQERQRRNAPDRRQERTGRSDRRERVVYDDQKKSSWSRKT